MTGSAHDTQIPGRRRIAVVGSGVAGLTAAWILKRDHSVTLYESDNRAGGHAHTHPMELADGSITGVDTGFIVHNDRTYPTLTRLFEELGVQTQESDMTMSVRCDGCGLEYAGAKGGQGVFAQPRSFTRGRYLRMLVEILRFQASARALLRETETADDDGATLGEFLSRGKFSDYFTAHFMTPVVSAVWSCDPRTALQYPARYLFTFLDHHGMLTIRNSPQWRTVTGGSGEYVRKITDSLDEVLLGTPVTGVRKVADGVVVTADGESRLFDGAVIAAHPEQALAMLGEPTPLEEAVLGFLPYSRNHALFHTDESVLPRSENARSSWNYRLPSCHTPPDRVLVTYDLSRLQRLDASAGRRFLVSLGEDRIDQSKVIETMTYDHPQYTPTSFAAQGRLAELSDDLVAFAGAYHGWGFHEDGALSGRRAAERLGGSWLLDADADYGDLVDSPV
ncbi:putative NAD/FAD-binding protein [Arthrobacter pigmenti]|uniref:Putative NAD/FAD-binding protein n=1 Tax=Arthrobacter pigmenti TaxID=271432 RepID=A0A846RG55_9MICC|nr:FAD-dependent oxidoreductase [Arthrobacter pigmenti]NJC22188.1 putative NAD/FAD-binding protein [Arthrobacter pigmenti]